MAKLTSHLNSLKDILEVMKNQPQWKPRMDKVAVEQAWGEVMGPGVMAYTQRVVYKEGSLWVYFTSTVLREELSYGKSKILDMLNAHLNAPMIDTLIFK